MTRHNWISAAGFAAAATLPATTLMVPHAYAATPLVASSNSAALTANIVVDGVTLSLPNVLPAAGSVTATMTAPYAVTTKLLTYSKSITSGKFGLATTAGTVIDKATSPTHTATSISATASSSIASFSSTLTYSGIPVVSIVGTKLVSNAKSTLTSTGVATSTGTPTTIGSLTISAPYLSLIFNPLPAPGTAVAPNYVLAHNAANSIIIYLNRQITTGPTPAPGKPAHYTSINVDVIDVHIASGYSVLGHTVSGDIEVGSAFAN